MTILHTTLKNITFVFAAFIGSALGCHSNPQPTPNYAHQKLINYDSLAKNEAQEKSNPGKFIKTHISFQKLNENQWRIKGMITSTAMISAYNDVFFTVYFFDSTKTILGNSKIKFVNSLPFNFSKPVDLVIDVFPNTDSLAHSFLSARNLN